MPKAIRFLFAYLGLWMLAGFVLAIFLFLTTGKVYAQTPNRGCNQTAIFDTSTSGNIQLQALVTGQTIRLCGWGFFAGGTTAVKFVYGTGMACATGSTDITPAMPFTINTSFSYPSPYYQGFKTAPGTALCVSVGSSAKITGFVTYSIAP
jgi:hypothetical protein